MRMVVVVVVNREDMIKTWTEKHFKSLIFHIFTELYPC
jgi:hypothetical protein